eukprot:1773862-Amphidinium_carterae.1
MELSAVAKGGKGKEKGKDKSKHETQKPDWWSKNSKGKGKTDKPDKGGKATKALCNWCQKPGHFAKECRAKAAGQPRAKRAAVNSVEADAGATASSASTLPLVPTQNTQYRLDEAGMAEMQLQGLYVGSLEVCAMSVATSSSRLRLGIDSCAGASVIPRQLVQGLRLGPSSGAWYTSASGQRVADEGG